MKLAAFVPCWLVLVGLICVSGCQKNARVDASQSLKQSFQSSEPEVRKEIAVATANLKAGNYKEMAKAMDSVLAGNRNLTQPQKEAVELLFKQINQTLTANPRLDSKELYDLRVKLHQAATGPSKF